MEIKIIAKKILKAQQKLIYQTKIEQNLHHSP